MSLGTQVLSLSNILNFLRASQATLKRITLVGIPFWIDDDKLTAHQFPVVLDASLEMMGLGDWPSSEVAAALMKRVRVPHSAQRCYWGRNLQLPESSSQILFDFMRGDGSAQLHRVVFGSIPGGDMIAVNNNSLYINGSFLFEAFSPLLLDKSGDILPSIRELVLTPFGPPTSCRDWSRIFAILPLISRIVIRDAESGSLLRALT